MDDFDLRTERTAAGLSQQQLAARSGISQSNISAIENGARRPTAQTIERLRAGLRPYPAEVLADHADQIRAIAARHGLSDVRVFGSITAGTDTWDSDIDLLVTAAPGTGLFALAGFAAEASELLGYPVDVLPDSSHGPVAASARHGAVAL